MYNVTRQKAADILNVSTRSIDRYVKSWKLRAKKEWKIIYIHTSDIEALNDSSSGKQEVIVPNTQTKQEPTSSGTVSSSISRESSGTLEKIYIDLRSEIQRKDTLIQNLSIQLGEAKEIAKNSVSLIEFKKSQFLLEESKWYLNKEVEEIQNEKKELSKQLKYEKSTNYILIAFVIVLFVALGLVWFIKI